MEARLAAHLGGDTTAPAGSMAATGATLPPQVADGLSRAMAESIYLPMVVILLGAVAALFFERPRHLVRSRDRART